MAALEAAARDHARPPRDHPGGARRSSTTNGFTLVDAPDLHAQRLRGHVAPCSRPTTTASPPTSPSRRSSTAEAAAAAFGKAYVLRPDLPRREVQDAPPPGRVLDGGARGRLHGPRRATWTWPRTFSATSCRSVLANRASRSSPSSERNLAAPRARCNKPFPRIRYNGSRRASCEARRGIADFKRTATTSARPEETAISREASIAR